MPCWIAQSIGPLAFWCGWRRACALGIGFSYCLTYLLISWCLATGVFHPRTDAPHASPHHAGVHAHDQHHDPAADTPWADICDFALQALLASAWLPAPETVAVWSPGEAIRGLDEEESWPQVSADLSIRSPPLWIAA